MIRSILIAAALVATAATGAHAQQREAGQVSVKTDKVDFANAAQTQALYGRINAAAKAVCDSDVSDPMTDKADADCRTQAITDAVRQINAPQLTALAGLDRATTYADARGTTARAN